MAELRQKLTLPSQIGWISFDARVTGPSLVSSDLSFRQVSFRPKLPRGMSVLNCTAVLLEVQAKAIVQTVWLQENIATAAIASPCTGENLDAQEWSIGGNLVVIGTEDGVALDMRYQGAGFADLAVVDFAPQAMTLRLTPQMVLCGPSFHFIVAENPYPEPVDASAWFAVDQSHESLLRLR